MLAPACNAARATAGFVVSTESGILTRDPSCSTTGITRCHSSVSPTGSAPGRVDSPPMSRISAPCATSSSACSTAFAGLKNFPPSEKESGVTLTTPMTSAGRGKRNSNCRARKSIGGIYDLRYTIYDSKIRSARKSYIVNRKCSDLRAEIRNRVGQSVGELHFGFPFQKLLRLGDVGLALLRIVLRQRLEDDFAFGLCRADDFPGELAHGQFRRIADVHRQIVIAHHQPVDAFNQIRDVAKAARLVPLAKNGDGFVLERLADECRHDAAVVQAHSRAVGVEDSHDARLNLVFAVIRSED